jgi:hypothetical protein
MANRKKKAKKISSRARLLTPTRRAEWFEEPELSFAEQNHHVDPKIGINLFGPRSYGTDRHRAEVHFGFIGTGESIEGAARFYEVCSKGVDGDTEHEPFPGCSRELGLRLDLKIDTGAAEIITSSELHGLRMTRSRRDRFENALALLEEKLRILKLKDRPIDYVVFAIPEDLYDLCKTVEYTDTTIGRVHQDLRRAFKVLAMKHDKATQIILNRTTTDEMINRQVDHKSVRAWNLFTGLYFKVDGIPWAPFGLDSETCYVGIAFYRPKASQSYLRASLAQAFDDRGEGFVLRGREFEWDEEKNGRSPHLAPEAAQELIDGVVQRYKHERKTFPRRIVIHKSSEYRQAEREGFMAGLKQVAQADMIALRPSSRVRLVREGLYPPLRGTAFHCGDITHFYTTGYIKILERYPHGHVPSPIEIYDHHGDSSKAKIIEEVLILTKMNWNSADFCGSMPITLRFARLVGDILREMPEGFEPNPKYKFYM